MVGKSASCKLISNPGPFLGNIDIFCEIMEFGGKLCILYT